VIGAIVLATLRTVGIDILAALVVLVALTTVASLIAVAWVPLSRLRGGRRQP